MKKSRKILASFLLSSAMVFSLTMSAVAEEADEVGVVVESEPDVSISMVESDVDSSDALEANEVSAVIESEPDEQPDVDSSDTLEAAEPRWYNTYEFIDRTLRKKTIGGKDGQFLTIEYGVYIKYFYASSSAQPSISCYGVMAKVINGENNIKTNFTVTAIGRQGSDNHKVTVTNYGESCYADLPADYDYINISGYISVEDTRYGSLTDEPINRNLT